MNIRYEDADLQRMYEVADYRSKRWQKDIIRSFRKVVQWIMEADSESDLYAFKSLHYEKLKGNRVGQRSVRLNDQFRLILRIENNGIKAVVVIEIVDYH